MIPSFVQVQDTGLANCLELGTPALQLFVFAKNSDLYAQLEVIFLRQLEKQNIFQ